MNYFLLVIQFVVCILLSTVILLQAKDSGFDATFSNNNNFSHTRRGGEKVLFQTTIALAFLFVIASSLSLILLS
ncbi:preprotein translocase subunit SecG [Candidatus Beckwithbacteria bacterium]|nr:preprotein translocase subunit SecG [Candidatus Beckwithbacteria bacterium]